MHNASGTTEMASGGDSVSHRRRFALWTEKFRGNYSLPVVTPRRWLSVEFGCRGTMRFSPMGNVTCPFFDWRIPGVICSNIRGTACHTGNLRHSAGHYNAEEDRRWLI